MREFIVLRIYVTETNDENRSCTVPDFECVLKTRQSVAAQVEHVDRTRRRFRFPVQVSVELI